MKKIINKILGVFGQELRKVEKNVHQLEIYERLCCGCCLHEIKKNTPGIILIGGIEKSNSNAPDCWF